MAQTITMLDANQAMDDNVYIQVVETLTVGIQTHQEINRDEVEAKLAKEITQLASHIENQERMLNSGDFRSKAPAHVIADREKSLQENKDKLAKLTQEHANISKNK